MKTLNIIKCILLFLVLSGTGAYAQNITAWSVLEYDSIAPASVVTKGTRLAYSKKYNSFYRWDVICSCWKRFAGPGITDTTYSLSFSSPNLSLLGSGSSVSLTSLYTAGWGLTKTSEEFKVDTSKVATRYYARTLPTSILSGQVAYSNGSNLVGSANFTYASSIANLSGSLNSGVAYIATNTSSGSSSLAGFGAVNNTSNAASFYITGTGYSIGGSLIPARTTVLTGDGTGGIVIRAGSGSGTIRFAASTSNEQMTLATTGNLLLGTTTDVPTSILTARSTTKSSSPFPLHTLAQSDAITGVQGNFDYETTQNGLRWHNGTRKAYALESTFARGTATYVPHFDANGQLTQSGRIRWNGTQTDIYGSTNAYSTATKSFRVLSLNGIEMFSVNDNAQWTGGGITGGGNNLTVGTSGSGFPALYLAGSGGTRELYQHETGSSVSLADNSYSNILVFSSGSSFSSAKTMSVWGRMSIGKTTPNYDFDVTSTDAYGLPRGTVAQRPTIITNTTPFRYNTDSTALEYGESVGTWRQLATRAYARSLVASLSPDTWLGTRLNAANVDINANGHELRIDSLSALIVSAESTSTLGGAGIEQIKWLNTSRTKYFNRRLHYDSRSAISGGMPAFYNLLTINMGAGDGFEWANGMIRDTTAGVFVYGYGGRYNEGYLKFGSIRSNTAGVYLSVPRFWFYGTSSPENATANTYHTLWSESNTPSSMLMGLKDGGKFLIGSDSTFIFDPTLDVPQFNKMGVGNKEAADLSKTQSNYVAGFATDGTVVDYNTSSLPSIYNNLPNGNVRVDANANSLRLDSIASLTLSATNHTGEIGTATIAQVKKLNAAGTKYYDAYYQYDSRNTIANGTNVNTGPAYSRLFVFNQGAGEQYEWTDMHVLDTANTVFGHMYGARYYAGLNVFRSQRPTSGGAYRLTSGFDFFEVGAGNQSDWTPHTTWRKGADTLMQIKENGLLQLQEYTSSAPFTPNAIGEEATELFLTTSATTGKVLQRKMRETSFTNSNASVTDDMLELAQDVFMYANCLAIATDSTVVDLPTPSVDYIGQVVEVCGDGRNATPNYQVYVRGVGATLWHQAGGADPSAQTYLEVTNLSSNHNTVKFICAQPSGSTYYWILLKQP